jgi:hypothetical protein
LLGDVSVLGKIFWSAAVLPGSLLAAAVAASSAFLFLESLLYSISTGSLPESESELLPVISSLKSRLRCAIVVYKSIQKCVYKYFYACVCVCVRVYKEREIREQQIYESIHECVKFEYVCV